PSTPGSVTVHINDGTGTGFHPPVVGPTFYPVVGRDPTDMVAADFNGDGHLDLAVCAPDSNQVTVLWGDGDGSFDNRPGLTFASGGALPVALAAGDFNGDHKLDLAVSNQGVAGHNGAVVIFHGGGS